MIDLKVILDRNIEKIYIKNVEIMENMEKRKNGLQFIRERVTMKRV